MGLKADEIIDMLHRIREENYEATKDLTSEEWAEAANKRTEEFVKKYGLKLKVPKPIILK